MGDLRLLATRAETRRLEDALAARMTPDAQTDFAAAMLRTHLCGARPWRVAVAEDLLSAEETAQTIAEWADLRYVDLSRRALDPALISMARLRHYTRWGYAPLFQARGLITYAAVDPAFLPAELHAIPKARVWVVSERALLEALEQVLRPELTAQAAAVGLFSARHGWSWAQRAVLIAALAGVVAAVWTWSDGGGAALITALWLVSMVGAGLRIIVTLPWPRRRPRPPPTRHGPEFPPPPPQPAVSILIPLYKEADCAPALMQSLASLDYPKAQIDARVLVESDDLETLAATRACAPPHVTVMVIPDGRPRTKPRAMNYALPFARGSVLTVFDAEDRPDKDQISKAVQTLAAAPRHVVCAQARLRIYNGADSWISRLFAIEYCAWFRYVLPGLARLGAPVPLGGTSFYIKTHRLREVGGWDAWNVTEDADLGLRLYRRGWRATVVDSDTWEEATAKPRPWIGQRSRWIKGFLQTIIAHTRAPIGLAREAGFLGTAVAAALFLTPAITFLLLPVFWIALIYGAIFGDPLAQAPEALRALIYSGWLAAAVYLYGLNVRAATFVAGWRGVVAPIWFILYWPLATAATARAALELAVSPFYWRKTSHVVSPEAQALQQAALKSLQAARPDASAETAPVSRPPEPPDPMEIIDQMGFGAYKFQMSDASDFPNPQANLPPKPPKPPPQSASSGASSPNAREERLAAALRANMRRRKAQARSRKQGDDGTSSPGAPSK